ncbi:ExeM/NucH family extracellular endonuclease [Paraneptunicella aestuarii]|uniref:ExeM/NucH family extracellular endonuclease n=1 Tax=Paraneptunicella aestuarii TaxID=2831148 RepID=UPI001E62B17F|nr:ExeM/NucH family extracellular endonuclease [Paraneptunicella aestuarii]UAA38608.1 ExeM/NucH family extracellular endonuclease [Paraneptunicella aestuarii]
MKKQISVIAAAVLAATQAQAVTANFGWEDGSTVLGQYGADHIQHSNSMQQAYTGSYSLLVEDVDPIDNGTPQSFVAWVNGLTDGDTVTVSMWVHDDAADRPAGRIWGHYTNDASNIDSYAGSAGGNSTYTDGSGWQQISYTWTFDSSSNTRDGLVVEFRVYDSADFTTGSLYVDDIEITSSAGSITLPSGEVITGDTGSGDNGDNGSGDTGAGELYFSEYVEGSSNNKALEIYNPTGADIDLAASGYSLARFSNGGTTPADLGLTGTIAANDVFVLAHSSADAAILAVADQITGSLSHNGDDAYVLYKDGVAIDSFGQVGVDPGSAWGIGDSSTANNTLRRLASVTAGDTIVDDAFDPAVEWQGFGNDDFSDLGSYGGSTGGDTGGDTGTTLTCGTEYTAIHTIQGAGAATTLTGEHEVEAVVTADMQAGISGFYLQTAVGEDDGNAATSEGIFVYTGSAAQTITVGDRVRVKASVGEYNDMTQLSNVTALTVCASGQALPAPVELSLPFAAADSAEPMEGMIVNFNGLTVNDTYNLGRYGQVTLSNGRRMNPTQVAAPGEAALAVSAQNALNSLVLDDGSNAQNPTPIPFPNGGLTASNTLRVGDTVTLSAGVLHYSYGEFRVYPIDQAQFTASNPRTIAPELEAEGNLNIASFNVLNYFNTMNVRGANTEEEFARQRAKILAAISALDADIIGLLEIENDGYGADSSIADLVAGLNEVNPGYEWQYVNPGVAQVGTDAIASGIIYRSSVVAPVGDAQILDSSNSIVGEDGEPLFLDYGNRPALSQAFMLLENKQTLAVAINHLKSKGTSSTCAAAGDADKGDGQGHCNLRRTNAAQATGVWLNELFPEMPVIALGDLNSYAKEDPLTAFADNGFVNLFEHLNIENAYSYVYSGESGQLDHALANAFMLDKVVDVTEWHINTDEPRILDYNTEYKTDEQLVSLYAADAYRSSDHDPVIVSINLEKPFDPNLTDIEIAPVSGLSHHDKKHFTARANHWLRDVAKWQREIAKLEAEIAALDPEKKAEKIARKQASIIQKQAKSAIYQSLADATLFAVDGTDTQVITVVRQLALSERNEEKLLRKQYRFDRKSSTEKAAKLEAKAAALMAKGKTRAAEKLLAQAESFRAKAAVYSILANVISASLEVE